MPSRMFAVFAAIATLYSGGCTIIDEPARPEVVVREDDDGDRILIVDRTGAEWDVTHAVERYGMDPKRFENGLGRDTIRPLINPGMLSPGDPGYPPNDDPTLVIGTVVAGEKRAYRIPDLKSHEIVDETFVEQDGGRVHVAVGW